ncbi:MAG: sigma-70 family RNA polymerase sigma factor [Candidatus Gracilibacteria bacterium]|jgi:RNA polymerase sigma factor (sigma-70 family)
MITDSLIELGIYGDDGDAETSKIDYNAGAGGNLADMIRGNVDLIRFSRTALKQAKIRAVISDVETRGLIILAQNGDMDVAQEIVERNLRFIISRAVSWSGQKSKQEMVMELIQDGVLVAYRCVKGFDHRSDCTFLTYLRGALNNFYGARLRAYVLKHGYKDSSYGSNRIRELKTAPGYAEVVGDRQVNELRPEEIEILLRCGKEMAYKVKTVITSRTVSIEAGGSDNDDDGGSLGDMMSDGHAESPESVAVKRERRRLLMNAIGGLDERDQLIVSLKFNLNSGECGDPVKLCRLSRNADLMKDMVQSVSGFMEVLKGLCEEFKPRSNGVTTMKRQKIVELQAMIMESEGNPEGVVKGENILGRMLRFKMDNCTETLCVMAMNKMTEFDRVVLSQIFTIPNGEDYQMQAICDFLGITRERVNQIWHRRIEPYIKRALMNKDYDGHDERDRAADQEEYLY